MKLFRQGDVLLKRTKRRDRTGTDLRSDGRIILAYGEVTGHAHTVVADTPSEAVPAAFFEEPGGRRFLFVDQACLVTHQEHGSLALAPGVYEVVRQREYAPDAIRSVED